MTETESTSFGSWPSSHAITLSSSKVLNLLLLGETQALVLGLNLSQVRVVLIANVSILAGTVTAFCGSIAFIGIAVPHLGRALLKTADHRLLIPAVMVLGANLAIAADLFAQLPGQQTTCYKGVVMCFIFHLNGMYSTAFIHSSGSEALAINSKSLTN